MKTIFQFRNERSSQKRNRKCYLNRFVEFSFVVAPTFLRKSLSLETSKRLWTKVLLVRRTYGVTVLWFLSNRNASWSIFSSGNIFRRTIPKCESSRNSVHQDLCWVRRRVSSRGERDSAETKKENVFFSKWKSFIVVSPKFSIPVYSRTELCKQRREEILLLDLFDRWLPLRNHRSSSIYFLRWERRRRRAKVLIFRFRDLQEKRISQTKKIRPFLSPRGL